MVGKNSGLIPLIFLIADGTVEDERDICNMMKFGHVDGGLSSPRIFAFGIGGLSSLKNKIVYINSLTCYSFHFQVHIESSFIANACSYWKGIL